MGVCSCQEDPLIEQLRQENPFRKPEEKKPATQKILRVSCDTLKIEMPATFDIGTLEVFNNYLATSRDPGYVNPAIVKGFGSMKLWHENGFIISIVPRSLWNKTLQQLEVFFSDQIPQSRLRIFSYVDQYAELFLRKIVDTENYNILGPDLYPHKFSLTNGELKFRFECQPPSELSADPSSVYISAFLVFQEFMPYMSNSVVDLYRKSVPEPIISFDYLSFSGMLINDYVIVITCDDDSMAGNNSAGQLMYNHDTNNRVIAVLAPNAKMTEMIY